MKLKDELIAACDASNSEDFKAFWPTITDRMKKQAHLGLHAVIIEPTEIDTRFVRVLEARVKAEDLKWEVLTDGQKSAYCISGW